MALVRFAALMLAASVLWGAAANAAGPLRPFRSGFWSGGAYIDERTGDFTHCSAGVAYDTGVNLFVLVTGQYRWWLGFINPKWSFVPNAKTLVRLHLDGGTQFDRLAIVPNAQLLLVPLPDNSHLIQSFRHSAQLALDADGHVLFFKLNGTPELMDRLTACVGTSLALDETASPSGSQSTSTGRWPEKLAEDGAGGTSSSQFTPSALGGPPTAAPPLSAAGSSRAAPKAHDRAADASVKPAVAPANSSAGSQQSVHASAIPPQERGTAASPPEAAEERASTNAGSPPPHHEPARSVAIPAAGAGSPSPAGGSDEPGGALAANPPAPPTPMASPQPPAVSPPSPDGEPQKAGGSSGRAIAALPSPVPASTNHPETRAQAPPPAAGRAPLAFTAVNPALAGPPPVLPALEAGATGGTALEEARLATQFLTSAQLPDAHLIAVGKPAALADFAAVWRSEDAAGAVKIIPPGPAVSAIAIASNLIAVDPQICKGDFTSARLRTDIGKQAVFSAVLTCDEANEERVTQYFIAPRQQGGFVVFAVIRSKDAGQAHDLGRQNLEGLSRAAIEAVGGQG